MRILDCLADRFVTCLAMVLIAAVLTSPVACTMSRHTKIADAIKAGADPLETKCAVEGSGGQPDSLCLAVATRKVRDQ